MMLDIVATNWKDPCSLVLLMMKTTALDEDYLQLDGIIN
jgi:hypothetical protein